MPNLQNDHFDQQSTALFAAKLGLGLSALYYGVQWLIAAVKHFHNANELQAASVPFEMLSRGLSQFQDPSLAGVTNFIEKGLAITHSTAKNKNIAGAASLLTGGLCLFSAYRTAKSLVTGSSLGYVDVAVDTLATIAAANALRKKI